MNRRFSSFHQFLVPLWLSVALPQAQEQADHVSAVMERGPHHSIWRTISHGQDEDGDETITTNSFVEIASGLNRWDEQSRQYIAASDEIEIINGAGIAQKAAFKAIFSANVNDPNGSVDLLTPGGERMVIQCIGLVYTDDTGKSTFIAETKDSIGQLVDRNTIVWADAFDDVKADIRIKVALDGFENDVIISEQLPDPALFGLNQSTRLEVWHQVLKRPQVETKVRQISRNDGSIDDDQEVSFGGMKLAQGNAFPVGRQWRMGAEGKGVEEVSVAKQWVRIGAGREAMDFLIESVPYSEASEQMENLPAAAQARNIDRNALNQQFAQARKGVRTRPVSVAQASAQKGEKPLLTAALTRGTHSAKAGYAIDYITRSTGLSNAEWRGDLTYYVTGPVACSGTNTLFEGGAVIKFAPTNSAKITVNTPITWSTDPYRPVIFTARDAHEVGEKIGTAVFTNTTYFADTALEIDASLAGNVLLSNLRVVNAKTGVRFLNGGSNHLIRHAQFVNCQVGIAPNSATFALQNALFHNVLTNFNGSSSVGRCEHVTVNGANVVNNNNTCTTLTYTNSLFVNVTTAGTITSSQNLISTNSANVFSSAAGGFHYLPGNSPYRFGTTAISQQLLKDLQVMTTYAPKEIVSDFTNNTTLEPNSLRGSAGLSLGFHYWPMDYIWSERNLTNATLLLTNGVAVGFYGGTNGVVLRNGAKFVSEGRPNRLNRLVRYQNVQEQPLLYGTSVNKTFLRLSGVISPLADVKLRFTDMPFLGYNVGANEIVYTGSLALNTLWMQDCRVFAGRLVVAPSSQAAVMSVGLTNNLIERPSFAFYHSDNSYSGDLRLQLRNNLIRFGWVEIWDDYISTDYWRTQDNFFDGVTLSVWSGGRSGYNSHNAYRNSTALPALPGTGNVSPNASFAFANGSFGRYYQSSATLYNVGSQSAASAGLYHYTVRADQAKEATSTVDIGFHYVAADANGNPIDADGDGAPDYLEDANGNGILDSGESNPGSGLDQLQVKITKPAGQAIP